MIPQRAENEMGVTAGTAPAKMLLLHNIRSVHNVGSIFRTADGFGVDSIYISGHTPAPVDRFGRKRTDMAKVALGAEDSVKWQVLEAVDLTPVALIQSLKKSGVRIVVLEQDEKSVGLETVSSKDSVGATIPTLLIVGNEVGGVSREVLDLADVIAEIPMLGAKESFNVSVSAGIAMYQLFR